MGGVSESGATFGVRVTARLGLGNTPPTLQVADMLRNNGHSDHVCFIDAIQTPRVLLDQWRQRDLFSGKDHAGLFSYEQSVVRGDSNVALTKANFSAMWYWILNLVVAFWIFSDARTRKMELPGLWAAGCFVLMLLVVPFYLAKRPLKAGEVCEGGTVWNFCKAFSILWTVLMFVVGVGGKIATSNALQKANLDPSGSGMVFVTGFGFIMIVGVWFFVMASVLAMGFYNKNSIAELGPTGPLNMDADPHAK